MLLSMLILTYAAIVLAGGLVGYWKAGSRMSLISGVVSFVLLAVGFWLTQSNNVAGVWTAFAVAALLSVVFLIRFLKTKSWMPAGMMLIVSIGAAASFLVGAVRWNGYH